MKKWIRIRYTKWYNILKQGISTQNPIVISILGICSALAVTNRVENAVWMGIGVTFVIMMSSAVVSLLRNIIPSKLRMVAYMVIISVFTIVVDLFLQAFVPSVAERLGAYVGLIITNCIVMGRAEAFAVKNPVHYTLVDGFASGLGYTIVLLLVASVREILAFGTFYGHQVMGAGFTTWTVMAMAPGGFFVISLFIWGIRELTKYYEDEEEVA